MTEVLRVNFTDTSDDTWCEFFEDVYKFCHNIYWDKEVASLIDWHFEGKGPKFSRSGLYVRRSRFKNLAFPCRQGQGATLTELKASKRPKRIPAYIYNSAYSYLLNFVGQLSCTKTLRTFTSTRTRRFDMHTIFPLCTSVSGCTTN